MKKMWKYETAKQRSVLLAERELSERELGRLRLKAVGECEVEDGEMERTCEYLCMGVWFVKNWCKNE